ncbi:MAG: TlyA family RNA methyltransferase [Acidimicrobiales bacterium]
MSPPRRRLDLEMVRRGLVASRERAHVEIAAGRVNVAGTRADKPSRLVAPHEAVSLEGPPAPFVSRGGEKLAAALDAFPIPVAGADALDAGASTGGFTDCLLQRGAMHVVAVDVGRGQLHQRLRMDGRVSVVERANVRHLTLGDLGRGGWPFSLVVADLSFISLTQVAASLVGLAGPGADLVVLVKPKFEAGRAEADRGRGVIGDAEVWRRVLGDAVAAFHAAGAVMMEIMVSPLLGARGNVEFLVHLVVSTPATPGTGPLGPGIPGTAARGAAVDAAVAAGSALRDARRGP